MANIIDPQFLSTNRKVINRANKRNAITNISDRTDNPDRNTANGGADKVNKVQKVLELPVDSKIQIPAVLTKTKPKPRH